MSIHHYIYIYAKLAAVAGGRAAAAPCTCPVGNMQRLMLHACVTKNADSISIYLFLTLSVLFSLSLSPSLLARGLCLLSPSFSASVSFCLSFPLSFFSFLFMFFPFFLSFLLFFRSFCFLRYFSVSLPFLAFCPFFLFLAFFPNQTCLVFSDLFLAFCHLLSLSLSVSLSLRNAR